MVHSFEITYKFKLFKKACNLFSLFFYVVFSNPFGFSALLCSKEALYIYLVAIIYSILKFCMEGL